MGFAKVENRRKAKTTHVAPAPWYGRHRRHAHNHITQAGIRQPRIAMPAFLDHIIVAYPILAEAGS